MRVVTAPTTSVPLTVALEARWGGGKTFLLNLVRNGVEELAYHSRLTLRATHELEETEQHYRGYCSSLGWPIQYNRGLYICCSNRIA